MAATRSIIVLLWIAQQPAAAVSVRWCFILIFVEYFCGLQNQPFNLGSTLIVSSVFTLITTTSVVAVGENQIQSSWEETEGRYHLVHNQHEREGAIGIGEINATEMSTTRVE
jgi:hypothetical protein